MNYGGWTRSAVVGCELRTEYTSGEMMLLFHKPGRRVVFSNIKILVGSTGQIIVLFQMTRVITAYYWVCSLICKLEIGL